MDKDLRSATRSFYDIQKIRIEMTNRVKANERAIKEEKDPLYSEERAEQIQEELESIIALEKKAEKSIKKHLKAHPNQEVVEWLLDQPGIAHVLAGFLIGEIDIERAQTVSALWRYCGLAVDLETGQSERRRKGQRIHYNPIIKTKLLGTLGDNLIRAAAVTQDKRWRSKYDNYKHRKESANWGKSKGHRHRAALRYMIKMFLQDLWIIWRRSENLPITPTYQEVYLAKHGDHGVKKDHEMSQ